MTKRPTIERRLSNDARLAWRAMAREENRAAVATQRADEARADLLAIHRKTEERFGRSLPSDAELLDILDSIEIEDGDKWRWQGARNNNGLPTVRIGRGEKAIARYLAIQFGVISDDDFGTMYPAAGDPDDLNPFHRTLRRSPESVGNAARYQFKTDAS